MKKILIAIAVYIVGLYFSTVVYNEIHAWSGIFLVVGLTIGFLYYLAFQATKKK